MSSRAPTAEQQPQEPLPKRRLFGFTLQSDFGFRRPLPAAEGDPELIFTGAANPTAEPVWRGREPAFRSPLQRGGESVSRLYRMDGREVLHFDGIVDFVIAGRRIDYLLRAPGQEWLVELRFLGPVMAYWMECRGILCLHASAVAIGGRAALLVGGAGSGKTTIAAALLAAGHALLSDDVAGLQPSGGGFLVRPGYAEMRMWPTTAQRFLDRWRELPPAHPLLEKLRAPVGLGSLGMFHDELLPLTAIYLLDRRASGALDIGPVDQRPALIELVARSFAPHLVEAAGLQPERLAGLGRLVAAVPVRRLAYPAGHDLLPGVVRALTADLSSLRD